MLAALRTATAPVKKLRPEVVLSSLPKAAVLLEEIVSGGVLEATDAESLDAGARMKVHA